MNKICLVSVTNIDVWRRKMQGSNLWQAVDPLSHKYALTLSLLLKSYALKRHWLEVKTRVNILQQEEFPYPCWTSKHSELQVKRQLIAWALPFFWGGGGGEGDLKIWPYLNRTRYRCPGISEAHQLHFFFCQWNGIFRILLCPFGNDTKSV